MCLQGVARSFGARAVLEGIDLEIERGEFVALLGHSGCGKSTLLRIAAGLDPGATGVIEVSPRRAVVFQDASLLPWKRVLDNVTLGLTGTDVAERARRVLAEVGLTTHERAWPLTLSGGEAQRVALARALVRDPELLLLDEPFGALDALTRVRMHGLLAEMCLKYTPAVLFVTHDVEEALMLADRVLVLDGGGFVIDRRVELERPRRRTSAPFQAMREEILGALGVVEAVGGAQ
jgi:sulfonate transport system ATP-binding protein